MGKLYQEKFNIPFEMADVNGNLKLPQFLSKMLDVSERQSEDLGRSDHYLLDAYRLVWVVTDYHFLIHTLPRFNQEITIQTEAVSYNKIMCYREFRVLDEEGELMIEVKSYFALMDFRNRKIVAVPDDLVLPYGSEKVKKIDRGGQYEELHQPQSLTYHVRYFDIDMNGHVNNSKYLNWMYEVMGYDFLKSHQPKQISLRYNREISPSGDVLSEYEIKGLSSQHQITSDGQLNAQARIEWRALDRPSDTEELS